jgi:hypothetical protein
MLMTSNGSFTPVIILFYDRHNQNKIIETNSLFSTFFQRSTQDSVIFIDIAEKIQDYSPGRPYAGKQKRKKKNKTLPVGLGPQRGPHWPIGLGYQPGRKKYTQRRQDIQSKPHLHPPDCTSASIEPLEVKTVAERGAERHATPHRRGPPPCRTQHRGVVATKLCLPTT